MTIVLADDITGAAEIAGISLRFGLQTSFITEDANFNGHDSDVVVVATNIRSQSADTARRTTEALCDKVKLSCIDTLSRQEIRIFKKTDSALRGHISVELNTIMDCLGYDKALLIAQNPSKGRVIKDSTYYVGKTILSETMFAKDPEFPAKSSVPTMIIGGNSRMLKLEEPLPKHTKNIFIAEASTDNDIETQIKKADNATILAGGADLFESFIKQAYKLAPSPKSNHTYLHNKYTMLVISGSTQAKSIMETEFMKNANTIEFTIPEDVFEGADAKKWIEGIEKESRLSKVVVVRIGKHEFKGADYGNRLKAVLSEAAETIISKRPQHYLIIEGGATAFAILSKLKWNSFNVKHEYSPGVVGLTYKGTEIILKPGSYNWGKLFD